MFKLRTAAVLILTLLIAACSSSAPPAADTISGTPVAVNDEPANDGLVARVNGEEITQAEYDESFARRVETSNAASDAALAQQILNELIEQRLIKQNAESLGVQITDADVEAEIATQQEIAGSEAAWLQSLDANDYTQDQWYAAQRDALVTIGVRNVLLEPYFGELEQVNARHILVRSEETANEVLDRVEAGEGFATLAAEYSLDVTTSDAGGNLGWFARNELYYPGLENRAFDLEPGAISYVTTALGYHVIQTMAKEVRPVEPERLPLLSENIFNSWLDEQYRNATIEIYIQW